jgi:hypothetical protein
MYTLVSWCRAERERMLQRIHSLESGRLCVGEMLNGGLVDQSDEWLQTLRTRVAELDALILEHAERVRVGVVRRAASEIPGRAALAG